MKKNLLKMIHTNDFAKDAQFKNPSKSYIVPNVICSYCNMCKDVDLCKHTSQQQQQDQQDSQQWWSCSECKQAYDMVEMESRLLDTIQTRITSYQIQDLKCAKCGSIKAHRMSERCECSGEFNATELPFTSVISLLHGIATNYKMECLQQILQVYK